MTGQDVFQLTMDILSEAEADNTEFKDRCARLLNHLMRQTFAVNNSLRASKGRDPMTETPQISALTDTMPYEDELCGTAFPYGLAEKYVFDENDFQKVTYFNSLYASAVNDCRRAVSTSVEDVY